MPFQLPGSQQGSLVPDTAVLQLETDRLISTRGYTEITKRNASEMLSFSTSSVLIPSVAGGEKIKEGEKRRLHFSPCRVFFPRRISHQAVLTLVVTGSFLSWHSWIH